MEYLEYLENIRRFSDKTIKIYMKYYHDLKRFDYDYLELFKAYSHLSQNSIRIIVSAVICYYKFADDKRYKELQLPKKTHVVKDSVSFEEYKNILSMINHRTKTGFQKRLIIRLLFETGIRSQELLDMRKKDIFENRIKIFGKGRRERYVYISAWLQNELEEYCNKITSSKLFDFTYKNLYIKIRSLSKNKKVTPHMFRRGYARYLNIKGISIYDISLSMGHSNIETTISYINKDSSDVKIYEAFI